MDDCEYYPKARSEEITVQTVANEVVIYDLKEHTAYSLNPVAAAVWKHCDGATPVTQLTSLLEENGVSPEPAAANYVLDQLEKANLLDKSTASFRRAPMITRRDLLGQLGVGAAVVLSCVTMMTVPTVAEAQSSGRTGTTGPTGPD